MRRLIALSAALLLIPAAVHAQTISKSQTGAVGTAVTCTDTSGQSVKCVLPQVSLVTSSGAAPTGANAEEVQGNVASGADDSGNPVKVGCVVSTTYVVATVGKRSDTLCDANGSLARSSAYGFRDGTAGSDTNSQIICLYSNDGGCRPLATVGGFVNSAGSLTRGYDIGGAIDVATLGRGVGAVAMAGGSYSNITTATTTTVKSAAGFLNKIVVGVCVASATITLYDNTSGAGATIGTLTCPGGSANPFELTYDVKFSTGLTIVTSGATNLTVSYR